MIGLHKEISTPYYDGIRGLAVLVVWLAHTSGRGQSLTQWLMFRGIGHIGVMLFFVLSGFLLSLPINNKFRLKNYLTRKFLRITPLYYILLTLLFVWQRYTQNTSNRSDEMLTVACGRKIYYYVLMNIKQLYQLFLYDFNNS